MKINLKEVSVFLSAILLAGSYAVAQNPYRWTDELEVSSINSIYPLVSDSRTL